MSDIEANKAVARRYMRAVEEGGEPLPAKEKPSRLVELEKHYEKEFVADGLDNLVLRNKAAEGIN